MKRCRTVGLILLVAMLCGHVFGSVEPTIPERYGSLQLNGSGVLRKGWIFPIYAGALYLEHPQHAQSVLRNVPKRLDIHYLRNIPKNRMIQVAEKALKNNLSEEVYQRIQPKVRALHDAYLDGKKGRVASLEYRPGDGLIYRMDHRIILTLPGDEFANAYFAVWLGDHPSSRTMKKALLDNE